MAPDTLKSRLEAADAKARVPAPPALDPETIAVRARTHRASNRRAVSAMVLGVLAVGWIWSSWGELQGDVVATSPPGSETVAPPGSPGLERLAFDELMREADVRLSAVNDAIRLVEHRNRARPQERHADTVDPVRHLNEQLERTALILVHEADRMYDTPQLREAALHTYRRAVDEFSLTTGADQARRRLAAAQNSKETTHAPKVSLPAFCLRGAFAGDFVHRVGAALPPVEPCQDRDPRLSRRATFVLKIEGSQAASYLDDSVLFSLAHSSGVAGRAAVEVLNIPLDVMQDQVEFDAHVLSISNNLPDRLSMLVELSATLPEDLEGVPMAADDFLEAVSERLGDVLRKVHESDVRAARELHAMAEKELAETREELAKLHLLQRELCARSGQVDLHREHVLGQLVEADSDKRGLVMDLLAAEAERAALEQQMQIVRERSDTHLNDNPLLRELKDVVALRERALAHAIKLKDEAHVVTEGEVLHAREALTQARATLLERRYMAMQEAGGDRLTSMNDQLAAIAIGTAEQKARLAAISDRLEELNSQLAQADQFESEVVLRRRPTEEAMQDAAARIVDIQRRLRALTEPTVEIVAGRATGE